MTTIPATDHESLITRVKAAQKQFENFTQEQVDLIFRKAANLTVPRKNSALSQCAKTKIVRCACISVCGRCRFKLRIQHQMDLATLDGQLQDGLCG